MPQTVLKKARLAAAERQRTGNWPRLYFGLKGETGPQTKRYLDDVKKGRVPLTYWADEEYEMPFDLGSQSWGYAESGHSQSAGNLLDDVVGGGHKFDTVKPLKLFMKIIQLWCPSNGLVVDGFAGSGTTGHAVLTLNHEVEASKRRFILIESGNGNDRFCHTLTAERVDE